MGARGRVGYRLLGLLLAYPEMPYHVRLQRGQHQHVYGRAEPGSECVSIHAALALKLETEPPFPSNQ